MAITSGNNTITVSTRNRVRVFNKPTTSVLRKNGLVTLYEKSYNGGLTKKYDWDLETAISDGYATLDLLLDYLTQQLDDTGAGAITSAEIISALGYTPYSSANPTGFITASSLVGLASEVYVNGQGFLISSDLTPYLTITSASTTYYPLSGNPSGFITASALSPYLLSTTASTTYQQILVSGTNLKTINGSSLLGSGDITISGGGSYTAGIGLTLTGSSFSSNLSTGISGGQSAIGGTASGNNLTLSSTSNATKGKILFGTSAYNEVNNQLGIGTTSPGYPLDVVGAINSQVTGASVNFVAQNPWNGYPRGKMLIDYNNSAPNNVGFAIAPAYGTNSQFYQTLLSIDNNKVDTNSGYRSTSILQGIGYASIAAIGGVGGNSAGDPLKFSTRTFAGNNSGLVINNDTNQTVNIGTDTLSTTAQLNVVARSTLYAATFAGNVGIGQSSPTAYLHLKAGTATAGTAPIKLTSGTNLTTPENGTFEYDGTNLYFTVGGVRKTVTLI